MKNDVRKEIRTDLLENRGLENARLAAASAFHDLGEISLDFKKDYVDIISCPINIRKMHIFVLGSRWHIYTCDNLSDCALYNMPDIGDKECLILSLQNVHTCKRHYYRNIILAHHLTKRVRNVGRKNYYNMPYDLQHYTSFDTSILEVFLCQDNNFLIRCVNVATSQVGWRKSSVYDNATEIVFSDAGYEDCDFIMQLSSGVTICHHYLMSRVLQSEGTLFALNDSQGIYYYHIVYAAADGGNIMQNMQAKFGLGNIRTALEFLEE